MKKRDCCAARHRGDRRDRAQQERCANCNSVLGQYIPKLNSVICGPNWSRSVARIQSYTLPSVLCCSLFLPAAERAGQGMVHLFFFPTCASSYCAAIELENVIADQFSKKPVKSRKTEKSRKPVQPRQPAKPRKPTPLITLVKPIKPVISRFTNIQLQVHYVVLPPCLNLYALV